MSPEKFLRAYFSVLSNVRPSELERQRARLTTMVRRRRVSRVRPWLLAATLLPASLLVFWFSAEHESTSLVVRLAEQTVAEGEVIGNDNQVSNVEFSDGTRLDVDSNSSVRIASLSQGAARLILERGQLKAAVKKNQGIRWSVQAGPYRVRVIGTEFSVRWDAERQDFAVHVHEGLVRVEGGRAGAEGVLLAAGKSFEGGAQKVTASRPSDSSAFDAPAASEAALALEPSGILNPLEGLAAPATRDSAAASGRGAARALAEGRIGAEPKLGAEATEDWRVQARAGRYAAALQSALNAGGVALVEQLSVEDLLLLGHAARLSGRADVARSAYLGVRRRFTGGVQAGVAAFALGRLALDDGHGADEATRWFEAYLREATSGELAAGARSRLMDVYVRAGQLGSARRIARDYLEHHPTGPHAATARALTEQVSTADGKEQHR